ncbi:MAG: hypothetical protein ABR538_12470, partial [Candidatus Binatia bacterium]
MAAFHERQVVQMLLVRAAEEKAPAVLGAEHIATATAAALDARSDVEILEKRTSYLYLRLPPPLRSLAHAALLPEDVVGACLALAVLAGLLSNYIGPSGYIHVAYNPLGVLLAWNLAVLSLPAWRRLGGAGAGRVETLAAPPEPEPAGGNDAGAAPAVEEAPSGRATKAAQRSAYNWVLTRLYLRWRAWWARSEGARVSVEGASSIAAAFLHSYHRLAAPILAARVTTLLHVGAIGILVGAVAGTYLRGLFFEYNAVWRSTFLVE